jgi:hypothetical protein
MNIICLLHDIEGILFLGLENAKQDIDSSVNIRWMIKK